MEKIPVYGEQEPEPIAPDGYPQADLLHTDYLRKKYKYIAVDKNKLIHNNEFRAAHLIDGKGITRTFALTFFPPEIEEELRDINDVIKAGGLIGETFRDNGFAIRKNILDVYALEVPEWLKQDFHEENPLAKTRLTEFYARKGNERPLIYGTAVMETYTADFVPPQPNERDKNQIASFTDVLEDYGFSREEIWDRLDPKMGWGDVMDRIMKAREAGQERVLALRERVHEYMDHPMTPEGK